jgi:hypothetical protein
MRNNSHTSGRVCWTYLFIEAQQVIGTPIQRRCCEEVLEARIRSISSEDAWSSVELAVNGAGGFKEELREIR